MLSDNEKRSLRERLTLIRIFEELRELGYEGSYDAVRRYARKWRVERGAATAEAFVPLSFAPGEAYQFVARWCAGGKAEIDHGTFPMREDEPTSRKVATPH